MVHLLIILLVFCTTCISDHILVTSTAASYSHWNQILHISKGLLSRQDENHNPSHFITFVIDESRDKYLNTIRDEPFNTSSYQTIYTPIEPSHTGVVARECSIVQLVLISAALVHAQSSMAFENIAVLLNSTQSDSYKHSDKDWNERMNRNLTNKQNQIASLTLDHKVDVCLLDYFHFFAIGLCDLFNIPVLIVTPSAMTAWLEYYTISTTHLYFYNPFVADYYPDLINGTVMSYTQRCKTFIANALFKLFQRFMFRYELIPRLNRMNEQLMALNIDVSFDVYRYNNGWFSWWGKGAIISSLGPPFSAAMYHRSRVKQFGFILYTSTTPVTKAKAKQSELWTWINDETSPILLISMGSREILSAQAMHSIYTQLIVHSNKNNYRVLWALPQTVYVNQTNDALETTHFKIRKWIAQFEILQHENIRLFFNHGGSGGVIEAMYAKKLMVLFPSDGDQFVNAQRIVELGCGLIVKDKENMSDLTKHIETLLVNATSAAQYQKQLNYMHRLISKNGGVSDVVDFVEYASEAGIKHLLCTYGANYDCTDTVIPWYQESMLDINAFLLLMVWLLVITVKRMCRCLFRLCDKTDGADKTKID